MHSFFSSLMIQVLTHYKLIPPFLKQLFPKSLYQRKDKLTPMQYILVEQRTKKPFFPTYQGSRGNRGNKISSVSFLKPIPHVRNAYDFQTTSHVLLYKLLKKFDFVSLWLWMSQFLFSKFSRCLAVPGTLD